GRHERRGESREAARLAPVAESHARPGLAGGLPGVGRLHWKRALARAHHQPLTRHEVDELVSVREPTAEEMRNEGDLGADRDRRRRLPFDGLDVHVPARSIVWVRDVGRDVGKRPVDHGFGYDVDGHAEHHVPTPVRGTTGRYAM